MTPPWWSAHRRCVADTLVLLLIISPLPCVTAVKNRGARNVDKTLQPSSQPFSEENLQAPSSYSQPNTVETGNYAAPLYPSENTFVLRKLRSNNKLHLSELKILNHVHNNNNYAPQRKTRAFQIESSVSPSTNTERQLSSRNLQQFLDRFLYYEENLNKKYPGLQDVSILGSHKTALETSIETPASKELAEEEIFSYRPNANKRDTKSENVDNIEHTSLNNIYVIKKNTPHQNTSQVQYGYKNSKVHTQRKIKRSVNRHSDTETTQTIECINRTSVNNTCKNDGRFNFVAGNDDSSRATDHIQLNSTSGDRNRKILKGFSSLSRSRLTFPVQRKKLIDITDSGVGFRALSTSEPSEKHRSTLGGNNSINITASKSVNISYMVPSVKPAGRLAAANIPHESLDAASITGITVGSVVFIGVVGAMCFILYKRRNQNKPQTLSDKSSNPDSSVYIEESSDDSEEMYSLDNDSFLNSLEAMTIQNYWTENVKHTKL